MSDKQLTAQINQAQSGEFIPNAHGRNDMKLGNKARITSDSDAVTKWLASIKQNKSRHTYRNFKREIKRFEHWSEVFHMPRLNDLAFEDMDSYAVFLKNPTPADYWIISTTNKNPDHPSFRAGLSQASVRTAMSAISSFFKYLVIARYVETTPVLPQHYKQTNQGLDTLTGTDVARTNEIPTSNNEPTEKRYLARGAIKDIFKASFFALENNINDSEKLAKGTLLYALLYYQCLRCEEAITLKPRSIRKTDTGYEMAIFGKGAKTREIPVTAELTEVLSRLRDFVDIPELYEMHSTPRTHMLLNNKQKPYDYMGAYRLFNAHLNRIKVFMQPEWVSQVAGLSPHWLRHSGGTHYINSGVSLEALNEMLGHEHLDTTMTYVHEQKQRLNKELNGLRMK